MGIYRAAAEVDQHFIFMLFALSTSTTWAKPSEQQQGAAADLLLTAGRLRADPDELATPVSHFCPK